VKHEEHEYQVVFASFVMFFVDFVVIVYR